MCRSAQRHQFDTRQPIVMDYIEDPPKITRASAKLVDRWLWKGFRYATPISQLRRIPAGLASEAGFCVLEAGEVPPGLQESGFKDVMSTEIGECPL
jgi:hypothetical protein